MKRRLVFAIFAVIIVISCAAPTASAAVPYQTYTYTPDWGFTGTQTAYEPLANIGKVGDLSMSAPNDLRIGPDGNLYIADTNNRRIIISTPDGELVGILGEGILRIPMGVYPTDDGWVYVADEGLERVLAFDANGDVVREYTRPDHPLFGQYAPYLPQKVAVDRRGNVYVTSKGNTNGIIQFAAGDDAEFLGYFGANMTRVSLFTRFRRLIYTQEQRARMTDAVPVSVNNLTIDGQGLVYTISTGDQNAPLKKLNVAGRDIMDVEMSDPNYTAVALGPTGNIYAAAWNGWIYEYNNEGDMIFVFGAPDDNLNRVGLFKSISGIVVSGDGVIYVLDQEKNSIQSFVPTEFAKTVHTAFNMFNNGQYIESKEPWMEISKMNSLFIYANTGLGEASYREREYSDALTSFRRGYNYQGYSDAFWELRSNWLSDHMGLFIIIAALLVTLWQATKLLDRRFAILGPVRRLKGAVSGNKLVSQCAYSLHNIKNPADTAYGIKWEGKASWPASLILIFIFYLLFILEKYFTGFLFKSVPDGYYDLVGDLATILGAFTLTLTCCYLVCSISEGEATFRELVSGVIYAFAPIFIFKPVLIILTNVLTLGEVVFINLINFVAYAWTGILVLLAIRNLNGYTYKRTVKVILLTVFTCLICALLLFIIYVLISQFVDFVTSVGGEVVFKFGGN